MSNVTTVESEDSTMPYNLFALKHQDCFVVANALGDISGKGDGLFWSDTRALSDFRLRLGGEPLSLLSGGVSADNVFFTSHITNRPLPPLGGSAVPEGIIHIERSRFVWHDRLYETLNLVNYGANQVSVPLTLHFGADFRDIFEIRGRARGKRGELLPPTERDDHVILRYRGLDDVVRQSTVSFSRKPDRMSASSAEFLVLLEAKGSAELFIEVGSVHEEQPHRARFRKQAAKARHGMRNQCHNGGKPASAEKIFDSWLEKSRADMALLTTALPTGPYPYAGIPWFSTPFGRDAIISALQMLWLEPALARGVLRYLAENQAQAHSTFRDSAPGKIMHETRKGEMSLLDEVPFRLYYGGVDTTPLFLMLARAYAERTGDMPFIEDIWPALELAIGWVEGSGEPTMDGLLGYQSGEATGLRNQGWKDSDDSVFHADGEFPRGPIYLVEVQGYKFAALRAVAALSEYRGNSDDAAYWMARADAIREAVEKRFWLEDQGYYALALDADGAPCRVRASNAGHLLFCGLPAKERAHEVVRQLLTSDFDTGWGIRTLANDQVRYNPMSYHNGSVWPHDTAICAAGMAQYGDRASASRVLAELFATAVHFDMRLPELFCGFQRLSGEAPIAYPVACLPQAWSSGSVFMALQAALGITVDGFRKEIHIKNPELPSGINHLKITSLPVGNTRVNLVFQRIRDRVTVFTEGDREDEVGIFSVV